MGANSRLLMPQMHIAATAGLIGLMLALEGCSAEHQRKFVNDAQNYLGGPTLLLGTIGVFFGAAVSIVVMWYKYVEIRARAEKAWFEAGLQAIDFAVETVLDASGPDANDDGLAKEAVDLIRDDAIILRFARRVNNESYEDMGKRVLRLRIRAKRSQRSRGMTPATPVSVAGSSSREVPETSMSS